MNKFFLTTLVVLLSGVVTFAADKKSMKEVDSDAMTSETQVTPQGTGADHMALVWWIPHEFWKSTMASDPSVSETDKQIIINAMDGVSLLAVVQADMTQLGGMNFYSKEDVERRMTLSFTDAAGKEQSLTVAKDINPDLQIVLGAFQPILGAAMGNLGNNFHFFVIDDDAKDGGRILDPYQPGQIHVQLKRHSGDPMEAIVETPINALFVPRKCPNGKDAHVSWKYCPWTGKKLEE